MQKADPNEKHVRTRLSALIIDIAFDVDSSHLADLLSIMQSLEMLPHPTSSDTSSSLLLYSSKDT